MAKDLKVVGNEELRTERYAIGDTTVIEAGDLVGLSSGLIIKATASSAKLGYAPRAHASGDGAYIDVTVGNDFWLEGDASDVFAASHRGGEYDVAVDGSGKQTVNQSGTTYKVLMIKPTADAGTVDSTSNVKVKINKPLDHPAD